MVRFPWGSKDYSYITDDSSIIEGDLVLVFTQLLEDQPCLGVVTQKYECPPYEPPWPIEKTRHIYSRFSFEALQDCLSVEGIAVNKKGVAHKYDYQTVRCYVTFPQETRTIGKYLFHHGSLHVAVIPEGVERIEAGAFEGAVGMFAVSIPSTVSEIAEDAFAQCLGVREFSLSPDNLYYKKVGPYIISDRGATLFRVWDKMESVFSIPDGIKVINHSAFDYCKVEHLVVPNGVEVIGTDAFQQCYQLKTIEFPESLLEIRNGAFRMCKSLEQIVIPKGVKKIGVGAFHECDQLEFVLVEGSETEVSNLFLLWPPLVD